jgi:hypothetical protein
MRFLPTLATLDENQQDSEKISRGAVKTSAKSGRFAPIRDLHRGRLKSDRASVLGPLMRMQRAFDDAGLFHARGAPCGSRRVL